MTNNKIITEEICKIRNRLNKLSHLQRIFLEFSSVWRLRVEGVHKVMSNPRHLKVWDLELHKCLYWHCTVYWDNVNVDNSKLLSSDNFCFKFTL